MELVITCHPSYFDLLISQVFAWGGAGDEYPTDEEVEVDKNESHDSWLDRINDDDSGEDDDEGGKD
jgi:hypothetical protein